MTAKEKRSVLAVSDGIGTEKMDLLATERPLTITVNGHFCAVLLASPNHLDELALGYAFNEGLISKADDLCSLTFLDDDTRAEIVTKNLGEGAGPGAELPGDCCLTPGKICALMGDFFRASALFRETGAVHAAALAGEEIVLFREDVARHNAIDKLAGRLLLTGGQAGPLSLLLSGRITGQVVKKACRMGIGLVISPGAASTLAVDLAAEAGLTLVGFAREKRFNVYCHSWRVQLDK